MSNTSWCRYSCFFDLLKQYIGYIFEKLYLYICNNLNTYMPTVSRSMPQFNWLMMLIMIPLQMLSGASTPRESMLETIQNIMLIAPTTHFVTLA